MMIMPMPASRTSVLEKTLTSNPAKKPAVAACTCLDQYIYFYIYT